MNEPNAKKKCEFPHISPSSGSVSHAPEAQNLPVSRFQNAIESQILASLPQAVAVFDQNLNITFANAPAGRYFQSGNELDQILSSFTDSRICSDWTSTLVGMIENQQSLTFSAVSYSRDDKSIIANIHCMPLTDSDPAQGIITIEDVTDKVAADTELAQNERLTVLGRIAGKVAHELNNPMDGILRYIGLASRAIDAENPDKSKEYLAHCRTGLLRMADIITQLLQFSRTTYASAETAPVTKIINDAVASLERRRKNITVEIINNADPEPTVRAGNLYQVFCNIIKNAFDAMNGQGDLTITVALKTDLLTISFADTGPGLPAHDYGSIFKPFFTTKPAGKGTGLGLCVCKELIEKLSGEITAQNNTQGGSTFTVTLPLTRILVE